MPTRNASATWNGDLKAGSGKVKLGSGAFEGKYNFSSRFESGTGTNPEELIAAAHAACYSMALSAGAGGGGVQAPPGAGVVQAAAGVDDVEGHGRQGWGGVQDHEDPVGVRGRRAGDRRGEVPG